MKNRSNNPPFSAGAFKSVNFLDTSLKVGHSQKAMKSQLKLCMV